MRRAIISDIHGNLEALKSVLDDISSQNIDEFYCLGDIIGYGPNPCECSDLVMDFDARMAWILTHDMGVDVWHVPTPEARSTVLLQ